jgi:hypothetical protein
MSLTFDDIVKGAREKTGDLPDPDSDSWRIGLEILLRDHARADILSERGWAAMKARYIECLAARMQVDDFIRRNPEVAKTPISRPVFILGMPRTGTTMVSYLMDADPATRSFLKWEAYNIVPPAAPGTLRTDLRCLSEVAKDQQILKAHPTAFATHYEAGDGPTECVHLLAQDFRSLMLAVLSTTPTYHDWILTCDMAPAFAHRKRALQILQSTNSGRWVLKMPSDSLFIRTLFETFPDAKVIWTHRDPFSTFASSVSMRTNGRRIFNKDPDYDYIRQRFPMQMALHVMRPLQMSKERPNDIYNQYYDDLVADPIAAMKRIYAWLGDAWTDAAQSGMQKWLHDNPQGRFGTHAYKIEDWGLSNRDLEPYFHDYLKVHPVARTRGD